MVNKMKTPIPCRVARFELEDTTIELSGPPDDHFGSWNVTTVRIDSSGSHETVAQRSNYIQARYLFAQSIVYALGYQDVKVVGRLK